jgi:uncharacterized protein YkwD
MSVLRRTASVVLAGLAAVSTVVSLAPTPPAAAFAMASGVRVNSVESRLLTLMNQARTSRGIPALTLTAGTTDVARRWAAVQASSKTMKHNPNLTAQVGAAGSSNWSAIGENVGYGPGSDPDGLFNMYMNSAPHRANILSAKFRYVGIGWAERPDGTGWNTQDFVDTYSTAYGKSRVPAYGGVRDKKRFSSTTAYADFESGSESRALLAVTGSGLQSTGFWVENAASGDQSGHWVVKQASSSASGAAEMRLRDSLDLSTVRSISMSVGTRTGTGKPLGVDVFVLDEFGSRYKVGSFWVNSGTTHAASLALPSSLRGYHHDVIVSVSKYCLEKLNPGSLSGRTANIALKGISLHV